MTDISNPLDEELVSFSGGDAAITAYMAEDIATLAPDTSLRDAAVRLDTNGVGVMVVGTADAIEGVVSERDILRAVALGFDLDEMTVADVESRDLKWATPGSTVGEVVEEMLEGYIRHVLVGDETGLIGIVSMRDLLSAFLT